MRQNEANFNKSITSLERTVSDQQVLLQDEKTTNDRQQQTIAAQQSTITTQNITIHDLQTKMAAMTADTAELGHVETGSVSCGASTEWKDGKVTNQHGDTFPISRHMTGTFKRTYRTPPVVFLATSRVHIPADHQTAFGTMLVNVNTREFTMWCAGWDVDDREIWNVEVDWVSIPH